MKDYVTLLSAFTDYGTLFKAKIIKSIRKLKTQYLRMIINKRQLSWLVLNELAIQPDS
jgi:hypothetical protein